MMPHDDGLKQMKVFPSFSFWVAEEPLAICLLGIAQCAGSFSFKNILHLHFHFCIKNPIFSSLTKLEKSLKSLIFKNYFQSELFYQIRKL